MPSCRATASAVVRLSPVSMTMRMPSALQRLRAPRGVVGLDRIGDGDDAGQPAVDRDEHRRSRRRARSSSASASSAPASTPSSSSSARVAERDARAARPCRVTPLPVGESKLVGLGQRRARARAAAATIAAASGCSLPRSTLAASRSSSASSKPSARHDRDDASACPRSACRSCRRPACRPSPGARAPRRSGSARRPARRGRRRP